MRKKYRALFAATAALFVHGQAARATDYFSTWNTTAGSWSSAANWLNTPSALVFPNNGNGDAYEVTVNGTGTNSTQLTLSQNIIVSSLAFSNADLLGGSSSGSGYSVSVLGAFNDSASGSFELQSGANLTLSGASTIASGTISGDTNTAINNLSGGTFTVNGSGETAVAIPLNNNGQVSVSSGTLSLQGGGSGSGKFTVASGATLETVSTFTGGDVANNGVLNIARLSAATFGTISGTGTLSVPSAPTTLNVNQMTQNNLTIDGGSINFVAANASTVNNLTITSNSSSPHFTGTATDNTTVPSTAASLTVNGVFNAPGNFTLNNGFILNLAGTGSFAGNNIDGGTNARINILAGAVIQHNANNYTYLDDALTTVAGEVDVNTGTFIIDYGGTHSGTFNVSSGAQANIGGGFSASAKVNNSGTFQFITSAGPDTDPAYPGSSGHNFNGSMAVQPGATLAFGGIGLPAGGVFFTSQSNLTMGSATTLNVVSGSAVSFNNQQALNIGTALLGGGAIFRNPGLNIGVATLSTGITKFENTGTVTIGTFNQTGLVSDNILRTGQEDNLPTTVSVGTFNLSGGQESGLVSVTGAMNWTGGIINADYGHVIIQPSASLSISGNGGTISQSGILDVHGMVFAANNLTDPGGPSGNSLLNFYGATTTVNGNLAAGNNGSISDGSNATQARINAAATNASSAPLVTVNVSAGATVNVAKLILLGNSGGGDAAYNNAGTTTASGVSLNDFTVTSGSVAVTTDTNSNDNLDPVLNGSIVGGYERDGQLNVNGGTVTAPYMKLGVTGGNTGTFTQTAGSVTLGILGAGNSGTLTSGDGVGMVSCSGGSLFVDTLLLGNTSKVGGGEMTVSGSASLTIAGAGHFNDLNVDSGTVTVLDQDAPIPEDPELDRSLVGGYLSSGSLNVSGGLVTTPRIKLGLTQDYTGTYSQTGGTVDVGTLSVGDDKTTDTGAGMGIANLSGGSTNAGTVMVGSTAGGVGTLNVSGTQNLAITSSLTVVAGSSLNVTGGTLSLQGATLTLPAGTTTIGNGNSATSQVRSATSQGRFTQAATSASAVLDLHNSVVPGTGTTLTIAGGALLGGGSAMAGEAVGTALFSGANLAFSGSSSTFYMAIGGPPTDSNGNSNGGVTFDQLTVSNRSVFSAGGATVEILPLSGVVLNVPYPVVVTNSGGTIDPSTFSNITTVDPSYPYAANYTVISTNGEIDVTFSSVPEPASGAIVFASASLALRRKRSSLPLPGKTRRKRN